MSNTRSKAGDRVTVTLRPDTGIELECIEAFTEDGDTVKLTRWTSTLSASLPTM